MLDTTYPEGLALVSAKPSGDLVNNSNGGSADLVRTEDPNHPVVKTAYGAITTRNHNIQKKPARSLMESLSP